MKKTKDSVLEINKLLMEVRPLVDTSQVTDNDDEEDEDVFYDAACEHHDDVPIEISIQELSKSVSDFLEICLQELFDI